MASPPTAGLGDSYEAPDLVPGLYNNGNTCYANSILQALAPLAPIHSYLADVAKANLAVEKLRRDREAKEHAAAAEDDDLLLYLMEEEEGWPEDTATTTPSASRSLAAGDDDDPKRVLAELLERKKEQLRQARLATSPVKKSRAGGPGGQGNEETTYTLAIRLLQTLSRLNLPLGGSSNASSGGSAADNPAVDLASVSPVFSDGNQHDAHEFLLHLLALVEDDAHLQQGWSDLQATRFEKATIAAPQISPSPFLKGQPNSAVSRFAASRIAASLAGSASAGRHKKPALWSAEKEQPPPTTSSPISPLPRLDEPASSLPELLPKR
jgi:Ubiquitin carboxyl-terminal hydrolase